jgi:hypothetical protein
MLRHRHKGLGRHHYYALELISIRSHELNKLIFLLNYVVRDILL